MNIRITCSELEIETIRDCLKALDGLDDNLYVKPGEDKIVSRDPVFQQVMSRSYSGDRYTVEGNIHQADFSCGVCGGLLEQPANNAARAKHAMSFFIFFSLEFNPNIVLCF